MKRPLTSLSFAFLAAFFPAAAAGQTDMTVSASCNGCHGNVYALLAPTAVLRHGGYSALVNTMNGNAGGSFSGSVNFIIGWLETNYPWASPLTLASGQSGSPYGPVTFSSNGGTSPFTWSVSGLPPGTMALNSSTGALSGTPSGTANIYTLTVGVTDSSVPTQTATCNAISPGASWAGVCARTSGSFTRNLSITAGSPALTITNPSSLPAGTVGAGYGAVTFTASGGAGGYTWSATGLPAGLGISGGGALTGTPGTGSQGNYNPQFTVKDSNNATANRTLSLTINLPLLTITGPAFLPAGTVSASYGPVQFNASGGSGGYTWTATGLPGGMAISTGGALSGTPAAGTQGNYNPQFTVKDSSLASANVNIAMTINAAVSGSAPSISSINPNPVPSLNGNQTITINGTGFQAGPGLRVHLVSGASIIDLIAPQVTFVGSNQLTILVNLGTAAANWTAQEFNPDLQSSNAFPFSVSGLTFIGSMPHLAAEENWITTFTLVNTTGASVRERLNLLDDSGNPLTVPLNLPQQSNSVNAAFVDQTVNPNASLIVQTGGPVNVPVLVGSAQLFASGAASGFAIFHHVLTLQETVVPLETRNASSYLVAFDNTNGVVLGVALANSSAQAAGIPVVIRDDTGTPIFSGSTAVIQGNGHTAFVLSDQFPATANKRGTIEFDTPINGQINVLAMRFTPPNNALTTIPVLANVGTSGGSIAHIAIANGWKTTFVMVNTGTTAAQVHLKFFGDSGNPLSLNLSFPQTAASSTGSSVDRSLAPGATLLVESTGLLSDPLQIGSAQFTTDGHASGFVILRYQPNGQEAGVPLETRQANGFVVAFDNTSGTATGVAVSSVSAQAMNIPVTVRDDAGAIIATDTITLAANGHYAFTLVFDRYSGTSNKRGTIEFDGASGQIAVMALRIPTGHTFTSLPALVK